MDREFLTQPAAARHGLVIITRYPRLLDEYDVVRCRQSDRGAGGGDASDEEPARRVSLEPVDRCLAICSSCRTCKTNSATRESVHQSAAYAKMVSKNNNFMIIDFQFLFQNLNRRLDLL